ncbi:MAG TPA: fibronectin type III domain-containing protein [Fimbriimonadaceae bacterium]|nr:fibronectin type III domain-containing protein [Fimbriimonadaceae bacterium]
MKIYRAPDAQLVQDASNFAEAATSYMAEVGYTAAEVLAATNAATAFAEAFDANTDAKLAARSAVQAKDMARAQVLDVIREMAKKAYANPNVTPDVIARLGLPVHEKPGGTVIPQTPSNLDAVAKSNGTVHLTWKSNGNTRGAIYWIEVKTGENGEWVLHGTTTRHKYLLTGQTPGVKKYIRLRAARSIYVSPPTDAYVVYENGNVVQLQIAA